LRHVEAKLDDAFVLLVAQRRRLAGRAARHHSMRALLDLPGDEILEAALVHRAVAKRRDRRDKRAMEHGSPPGGMSSAPTIQARIVPGNNAPGGLRWSHGRRVEINRMSRPCIPRYPHHIQPSTQPDRGVI